MEFEGAKLLLSAAHNGELEHFKKLAEVLERMRGGGIKATLENIKDCGGYRALHYAAMGGSMNVLKYLLEEMKVDVNVKDGSGKTPLSCAAKEGRLAAVEYLLRMGANPEIPDDSNASPLHAAAVRGHKDIIPLLLSKGINVDVMSDFGAALHVAAASGHHETVKVLLDHGANPNSVSCDTFTPLLASICSKSRQCVEQLLKAGADPNFGPDGSKALLVAAVKAEQFIKLLLEAGADPEVTNIHGLKPIEAAAVNDNRLGVAILFPVTSRIPSYDDWNVNGIMKHANSKKFKKMMACKAKENFLDAKSRGTSAFQRKEYWLAVHWYTEALHIYYGDALAAVLSNRSLCYVYLNKGDLALEDATQCVLARPDWPKAFYRKGVALKLLNRLDDAADAFFDGLKLDPKNKELEDAFREVSLARLKAMDAPL